MDTIIVQPSVSEITVSPSEIEIVVSPTAVIVEVAPTEINIDVQPLQVDIEVNPLSVEIGILTGNVTYNFTSPNTTVIAAENLSGHRIVTVEGYYASKDTSTDKYKILGMTTGAVVISDTATVQTYGEITNSGWSFTLGLPVFLSTNGEITQTPPTTGFRNLIGYPKTSTILFIEISEPYILA